VTETLGYLGRAEVLIRMLKTSCAAAASQTPTQQNFRDVTRDAPAGTGPKCLPCNAKVVGPAPIHLRPRGETATQRTGSGNRQDVSGMAVGSSCVSREWIPCAGASRAIAMGRRAGELGGLLCFDG